MLKPRTTRSLLALALLFFLGTSSRAQLPEKEKEEGQRVRFPKSSAEKAKAPEALTPFQWMPEAAALEAPIDPQTYVVGPGDKLLITIQSGIEKSFQVVVTPEGKLIFPTVGSLYVADKTLAEVQRMVTEAGLKKYLRAEIATNLVGLRSIRVHVTGQVRNPGPYQVSPVDRVSDIIQMAGGLTSWAFERGIEVRHLDGTQDRVDLYEYRKLGRLDSNRRLRAGDVVFVPAIDLSGRTVRVEGPVRSRGIYQLSENETLEDFLLKVEGLNRQADLRNAYIERKGNNGDTAQIIPIFPYLTERSDGHAGLRLQDGDIIMVPERREKVYVVGAVRSPGPYPFVPKLRVRDYVGLAGSTEQAVRLSKTRLIRHGSREERVGEDLPVGPGDTVYVPEKSKFGVVQAFAIVGQITGVLIALKAVGVIK